MNSPDERTETKEPKPCPPTTDMRMFPPSEAIYFAAGAGFGLVLGFALALLASRSDRG